MKKLYNFIFSYSLALLLFSCSSGDDKPNPDSIISFKDSRVAAICVQNFDRNNDSQLSYAEAAAVTKLGNVFNNSSITTFDELQFFEGLSTIGEGAFFNCNSLTSITIPENVTSIGLTAFWGCSSLETIKLPRNVKSFSYDSFGQCKNLKEIFLFSETLVQIQGQGLFVSSQVKYYTTILRVPSSLVEEYKKNYRGLFKHILAFDEKVPEDGSSDLSLEGTWSGNMYVASSWEGRYYDATSTEVTFLNDPLTITSGNGYWVDYYSSNAPWKYVANHIDWTVKNEVIHINFREDNSKIELRSYNLIGDRFTGTIYDNGNYIDFVLTNVSRPSNYWDDYLWGYDSWKAYSQ